MEKSSLLKTILFKDLHITQKIDVAQKIFDRLRDLLLKDTDVLAKRERYIEEAKRLKEVMHDIGMVKLCSECAELTGSCCGEGIEDWFTIPLILVNLVISERIPKSRRIEKGCLFLGEEGCLIVARHTICVNFLCKRLQTELTREGLNRFYEQMLRETSALFELEEEVKRFALSHADLVF